MKTLSIISVIFINIIFSSCKKMVDAGGPETQLNTATVYTSDATAIAVLTGMYIRIAAGNPSPNFSSGTESLSLRGGLLADEFKLNSSTPSFNAFYKNALISNSTTQIGTDYWNVFYDHIYYANSAITGLNSSIGLTPAVKNQLLGEAKFMRALFYFYLANLYGDVPLVTTTDSKVNAVLPRTSINIVYQQIVQDLKEAEDALSSDYLDGALQKYPGTAERVRPTKWAAAALLARIYLYAKDYVNAEIEATKVIGNNALFNINIPLNSVFLKNSQESIWQLQPVKVSQNTDDSRMYIVTTGFSTSIPVQLSDTLLKSFETNDNRRTDGNWVKSLTLSGTTYYFPYKYKNNTGSVTEYLMVLRLAEQYMIRAEARAQLNKIVEAQSDLNIIRTRANLPNTSATTQASLLTAILHERQIEFFSEWGHRWFDLKRTNTIDVLMSIMTPKKGGTWETTDQLLPIPFAELQNDPNITQNPGY